MSTAYILLIALALEIGVSMHKERIKVPYERQMTYAGRKSQRWFFNNYNGAEINYANAIRMDSTNYKAYWRRGQLRDRTKHCYPELAGQDLQKALELISMSISTNPNDTLYWSRGFIKIELGDSLGACEDFTRAKNLPLAQGSYKYFCTEKKP